MITTAEFKDIRATLVHRISGEIAIDEAGSGAATLVRMLDSTIRRYGTVNLIIDAKGANFTGLISHRTWSQVLDEFPSIKKKINYCVLILDDTQKGRAEKELMDSERLRFFFDFDEAVNWLRDQID